MNRRGPMENVAALAIKCKKCGELKPASEFYRSRTIKRGFDTYCKVCRQGICKAWEKANPEKVTAMRRRGYLKREKGNPVIRRRMKKYLRNYNLFRKYGITKEEFDRLVFLQANRCALCDNEFTGVGYMKPAVDHDHETGAIRGLLCKRCNLALGQLGDTLAGVMRAVEYLNKTRVKGMNNGTHEGESAPGNL